MFQDTSYKIPCQAFIGGTFFNSLCIRNAVMRECIWSFLVLNHVKFPHASLLWRQDSYGAYLLNLYEIFHFGSLAPEVSYTFAAFINFPKASTNAARSAMEARIART